MNVLADILGEAAATASHIFLLDTAFVISPASEPRSQLFRSVGGQGADHDTGSQTVEAVRSCKSAFSSGGDG